MKEQKEEERKKSYNLFVDADGNLTSKSEYSHGIFVYWTITSIIDVDNKLYFVSL